ncbi:hypothetical protein ACVWVY_004769 [Bradyrhizobium sp. URHC0002]
MPDGLIKQRLGAFFAMISAHRPRFVARECGMQKRRGRPRLYWQCLPREGHSGDSPAVVSYVSLAARKQS